VEIVLIALVCGINIIHMDYRSIYDGIYTRDKNTENRYNNIATSKFPVVEQFCQPFDQILDLGCGEGKMCKMLQAKGKSVFAVEVSTVACQLYLNDVPHTNQDILDFVTNDTGEIQKAHCIICTDVLEHLQQDYVRKCMEQLSKYDLPILFGIANHSDVQHGVELHVIREGSKWWIDILSEYFKSVKLLDYNKLGDKYFYISVN
jgi:SAM-dependent methyltransferase